MGLLLAVNAMNLPLQGKQRTVFVSETKFELSSENWNFEMPISASVPLAGPPHLKMFLMSSVVVLTKGVFDILQCMCPRLGDLHNSVSPYFHEDQCMNY